MKTAIMLSAVCAAALVFAESVPAPALPEAPVPADAPAHPHKKGGPRMARPGMKRPDRPHRGFFGAKPFGKLADGREAKIWRLTNANGMVIDFTDYGARVVSIYAPDKFGNLVDVTPGFTCAGDYEKYGFSMDCTIGRFGNRIAKGKFTLDGVAYTLPLNNENDGVLCCLHGGPKGWDTQIWKVKPAMRPDCKGLTFTYVSEDGEMGFPGTVVVKVTHWLSADNVWAVDYEATTDKKTVINLTNHIYFNLAGYASGVPTTEQEIEICADKYLAVGMDLIPKDIRDVKGTPFDFTSMRKIGDALGQAGTDEQLKCGSGWYDHNFVLRGQDGKLAKAAKMRDPKSGRTVEIWTTEPGMQMYGGQGHSDKLPTKTPGIKGYKYMGLALETQHYPDSPNRPDFPSTVLEPGQTYRSRTEYRFGAE